MAHVMTARPVVAMSARDPVPTDVLRRAQRGDEHAFAEIYEAHAPRLYATCLRLTGDQAAASDVLQDAFVRAWDALPAYRGESALATWLHRIAINTSLEHLRRDARRAIRVQSVESVESTGATSATARDAHVADRLDLERAMATLSSDARIVVVLRAIEGYSYAEISSLTGSSEVALRAQFVRARRTLAEYLER